MKKLKIITLVMTILFLGMSCVSAQEKSTVLVKAYVGPGYVIKTIKPDYTTYELKRKNKEEDALVVLKQELDKWILEGYVLVNSTTVSGAGSSPNETIYLLIKE